MNKLIAPVFREVFNRDFVADNFDDRLEMQKMIYLLQNLGINVGNYSYLWYKHGPYSQTLQNDILSLKNFTSYSIQNIYFSDYAKNVIERLKNAFFKEGLQYNEAMWIECLGSLFYIRESLLPSDSNDNTIIKELKKRKPHLKNDNDNKLALQTLKELFE